MGAPSTQTVEPAEPHAAGPANGAAAFADQGAAEHTEFTAAASIYKVGG